MKSKHDFPSLNAKEPEGIKPDGKPYNIMLVDSSEFQRKQIRQILESEGYNIIAEANNGQEAIDHFNKLGDKNLDIISTELDLPILDGYALLYEIKNRGSKVKVVFISQDTTKGVIQDLLKMGALDFILKPIKRSVLLDRFKLASRK